MNLPQQLQETKFRFLLIKPREKRPSDNWKDKKCHKKFDDKALVTHLQSGGNVGVLGGYGDLCLIDCDKEELTQELKRNLPPTLTEKSANGMHFFFIVKDFEGFITLDIGSDHYGEVRADKGHQTVVSPSIHPSGKKYEILDDLPIAEINKDDLLSAIEPFQKKQMDWEDDKYENAMNCPINDIVNLSNLKQLGNGEFQGSHPIHGSTTGVNFTVNMDKGVWHCFRHGCGGNATHLIAMEEGLMECGEKLEEKLFEKVLRIAKEKYGIDLIKDYEEATKEITFDDIEETLAKTIKKDRENKLITFSAMILAYTDSSQINIFNRAPSSTGKSYIPLELSALFKRKDVQIIGYSSPTAFFHDGGEWDAERKVLIKDLSRKILIFLDMPHDELLRRLRPMLSHDQKEILVKITDKAEKKGMRTKNVILLGFPTVIFCTANMRMDEQEATRAFVLSPETNKEKLEAAVRLRARKESNPSVFQEEIKRDNERTILGRRIRLIRKACIDEIIIPGELAERIETEFLDGKKLKPRHSRDIERLFSLIRAHALLNLWNRERTEKNQVVATENDYRQAKSIWDQIAAIQERGIPPYLWRIYEEVLQPLDEGNGFHKKEILRKHREVYDRGISNWVLEHELIPTLESAGLMWSEPDPENKKFTLFHVFNDTQVQGVGVQDENTNKQERTPHPSNVYINLFKVQNKVTKKPVPIAAILDAFSENDQKMAEKELKYLIKAGVFFEPQPGFLLLVNPNTTLTDFEEVSS